ncbi:hypothetical protein FQR65_LT12233 [Abscondita terminalis]|nr:hypothetical protein FQR65_LT12233 [Abscondita terminalis]
MKPKTALLYFFLYFHETFAKLHSISETNSLHACLSNLVLHSLMPLTYVLTDDEYVQIPKQYEKSYTVIKIDTFDDWNFSIEKQFVIYAKKIKTLEKTLNILEIGVWWLHSPKSKIIIVTDYLDPKLIFTKMWTRKIINVVVVYHESRDKLKNRPVVYTSNPFDERNECGEIPNAIVAEDCSQMMPSVPYKNFNKCPAAFLTFFGENVTDQLTSIIPKYIMMQLEESYNTSVSFYDDYRDIKEYQKVLLIMYLTMSNDDDYDKVQIYSDDFVWVTPVFKKPLVIMQNVFDDFTWIMIIILFLIITFVWWAIESITGNRSQITTSVLEVWCLTLCGCIKLRPSQRYLRSILVLYLFCMIVIHGVFKGNIIKALTVAEYKSNIKTVADVWKSKLILISDYGIIENYFQNNMPHDVMYTKIQNKIVESYYGLYDAVNYKNCNHLTVRYVVEEYQAYTNLKINYFVDNSLTERYRVSISLEKGHFFTDLLNKLTRSLVESGVYLKVIFDFRNKYFRQEHFEREETTQLLVLTVQHLHGAFIFLAFGVIASTCFGTMKPETALLYFLVYFHEATGKLRSISETNALDDCLSNLVLHSELPLTFVIIDDEYVQIPKQYEKPYTIIKIDTLDDVKFSIDKQFAIFAKNLKSLENVLNILQIGTWWDESPKCKIMVVTDSIDTNLIFTKMWMRKIIDVAIVYQRPNNLSVVTSNPFDMKNECGQKPASIVVQKCDRTTPTQSSFPFKNFNNCPSAFLTYFRKGETDKLMSVIPKFIMTQLERSYNTSVLFHLNYNEFNTIQKCLLIMFLTDTISDEFDKVPFFTDDFVWVTPIFKEMVIVMQNVFDRLTMAMIILAFLITSFTWWTIASIADNHNWRNQICISVLKVWCLTMCGCVGTTPSQRHLRSIFILYLFYIIIIHSVFKGNLIKALSISEYRNDIRTVNDVANSKLPLTTRYFISEMFFQNSMPSETLYTRIQNKLVASYYGLDDAITYKNCNHLTLRQAIDEYQLYTNVKINYFVDNSLTERYKVSFSLSKRHFFTDSLKKLTQTLIESGVYSKVIFDFRNKIVRQEYSTKEDTSKLIVLTVEHLYGVFVLLAGGIIASAVVFVIENCSFYFGSNKQLLV